MYRLLDMTTNIGFVTWSQVLDMFLNKMPPKTDDMLASKKAPLKHDNKFKASLHSRRETIAKVLSCTYDMSNDMTLKLSTFR